MDGLLALQRARDAGGNAVAGHVGQVLVHQQAWIRAAFAHQAGVEPLARYALELPEQVELWLVARVAPLGVEQALRQVEQDGRRSQVTQVLEVKIDGLADDALVPRLGRAPPDPG